MTEYNPEKTIVVVGYPRSGNTWLVRMIAEALNSPVSRFDVALPIGLEGQNRRGDWMVTQLHLKLSYMGKENNSIVDAWRFNIDAWRGERIILVYRDPRDVAISAMHYWDLTSHRAALEAMAYGTDPLGMVGSYCDFYAPWLEFLDHHYDNPAFRRYSFEELHENTLDVMLRILSNIELRGFDEQEIERINQVIENQTFKNKRKEIIEEALDGVTPARPYGKSIQLKAMRKGLPYQWMDEMSLEDNQFAINKFGEIMRWMFYQTN